MRLPGTMWAVTLAVAVALALALASCKGKPDDQAAAPVAAAPKAGDPDGKLAPAMPPRVDPAAPIRAEAAAFLTRWTSAQTALDVAAYTALYEPHTFRGVKRTADGKVREFDFAGWSRDRGRMFKNRFEIATEPLAIETWLDARSTLKRGMVIVRFTQRWRGGGYADHGVKVLHLWRGTDDHFLVTYEDLLNSEPGWERAATGVAAAALAPPRDQTEALALWRALDPRGADYHDTLASIPADLAVRRPMARALLATGNLVCTQTVEYAECGDERVEWADLDPKADLDDPCLRRRLAEWALGEVTAADLVGLDAELIAMASLAPPEAELPQAVSLAVADAPEATRLAVIGALMTSGREDMVSVVGLSDPGLVAALGLGVDAAALALDPTSHVGVLADQLAATGLELPTRHTLVAALTPLTSPAIDPALVKLTDDEDCELAMAAALALATRGDPSALPRRAKGQDLADAEHAICMLLHDPDPVRAAARLTEYIGPAGARVVETIEDPWAPMEQIDAGPDDAPEPDAAPAPPLKTLDQIRPRLDEVFGLSGGWERHELEMSIGDDGAPVIAGFDFYRYNGCGC